MTRLASKNKVSGKIMIEFLLAAPVLLSISGGTIEVANFMRLTQIATVTSQEAANQAYRKCSSITRLLNPAHSSYDITNRTTKQIDHEATKTAVETCLNNVRLSTMDTLNALNGNSSENAVHLVVARYNSNETDPNKSYDEFDSFTTTGTATASAYGGGAEEEEHGNAAGYRHGTAHPAGATTGPRAFYQQVRLDKTTPTNVNVKFKLANNTEVNLITGGDLQARGQVIVGQAVAGYTPIIRFFNLAVLYSGEFRATTLL